MRKSELKKRLAKERDRRYEERFRSITRAARLALEASDKQTLITFGANDKLVKAALDAAQRAADKSERSQDVYNHGHNDLTRKMESQYAEMIPRHEASAMFASVYNRMDAERKASDDRFSDLTKSRDTAAGTKTGATETKTETRQNFSLAWAVLAGAAGIALSLYLKQ